MLRCEKLAWGAEREFAGFLAQVRRQAGRNRGYAATVLHKEDRWLGLAEGEDTDDAGARSERNNEERQALSIIGGGGVHNDGLAREGFLNLRVVEEISGKVGLRSS